MKKRITLTEEVSQTRQQEIFDYLKANLSIEVDVNECSSNYTEPAYTEVIASITLINPETGKGEVIARSSGSF